MGMHGMRACGGVAAPAQPVPVVATRRARLSLPRGVPHPLEHWTIHMTRLGIPSMVKPMVAASHTVCHPCAPMQA